MTRRSALSPVAAAALALAAASAGVEAAPPRSWVRGIPDVMQTNSYSCGAAAVQAVGQRFGVWGYQEEWADELGTSEEQGTHPGDMVEVLRAYDLDARLVEGMTLAQLFAHIDRGDVVIVDYQAWGEPTGKDYAHEWEDGHYSIAVGYSDTHLYLEDPSLLGSVGTLTHADFLARWHDYEVEDGARREYRQMAIVVTGPSAPPARRFTPIE